MVAGRARQREPQGVLILSGMAAVVGGVAAAALDRQIGALPSGVMASWLFGLSFALSYALDTFSRSRPT